MPHLWQSQGAEFGLSRSIFTLVSVLGISASKFNDDRLGRTLDALYPHLNATCRVTALASASNCSPCGQVRWRCLRPA